MCQIHGFKREEKRKVTFRMGENEAEIEFMLIKKEHRQLIQNAKVIPVEFQPTLVIADTDNRKIRKVARKTCAERRKITLLKDVKIRKQFKEKVIKLADVGAPNLWGHFNDEVLKACHEVCWRKRGEKKKRYMVEDRRGQGGSFKKKRYTQGDVSEQH